MPIHQRKPQSNQTFGSHFLLDPQFLAQMELTAVKLMRLRSETNEEFPIILQKPKKESEFCSKRLYHKEQPRMTEIKDSKSLFFRQHLIPDQEIFFSNYEIKVFMFFTQFGPTQKQPTTGMKIHDGPKNFTPNEFNFMKEASTERAIPVDQATDEVQMKRKYSDPLQKSEKDFEKRTIYQIKRDSAQHCNNHYNDQNLTGSNILVPGQSSPFGHNSLNQHHNLFPRQSIFQTTIFQDPNQSEGSNFPEFRMNLCEDQKNSTQESSFKRGSVGTNLVENKMSLNNSDLKGGKKEDEEKQKIVKRKIEKRKRDNRKLLLGESDEEELEQTTRQDQQSNIGQHHQYSIENTFSLTHKNQNSTKHSVSITNSIFNCPTVPANQSFPNSSIHHDSLNQNNLIQSINPNVQKTNSQGFSFENSSVFTSKTLALQNQQLDSLIKKYNLNTHPNQKLQTHTFFKQEEIQAHKDHSSQKQSHKLVKTQTNETSFIHTNETHSNHSHNFNIPVKHTSSTQENFINSGQISTFTYNNKTENSSQYSYQTIPNNLNVQNYSENNTLNVFNGPHFVEQTELNLQGMTFESLCLLDLINQQHTIGPILKQRENRKNMDQEKKRLQKQCRKENFQALVNNFQHLISFPPQKQQQNKEQDNQPINLKSIDAFNQFINSSLFQDKPLQEKSNLTEEVFKSQQNQFLLDSSLPLHIFIDVVKQVQRQLLSSFLSQARQFIGQERNYVNQSSKINSSILNHVGSFSSQQNLSQKASSGLINRIQKIKSGELNLLMNKLHEIIENQFSRLFSSNQHIMRDNGKEGIRSFLDVKKQDLGQNQKFLFEYIKNFFMNQDSIKRNPMYQFCNNDIVFENTIKQSLWFEKINFSRPSNFSSKTQEGRIQEIPNNEGNKQNNPQKNPNFRRQMIEELSNYFSFIEKKNLMIQEQIHLLMHDLAEEQNTPVFRLFEPLNIFATSNSLNDTFCSSNSLFKQLSFFIQETQQIKALINSNMQEQSPNSHPQPTHNHLDLSRLRATLHIQESDREQNQLYEKDHTNLLRIYESSNQMRDQKEVSQISQSIEGVINLLSHIQSTLQLMNIQLNQLA